MKKILILCLLIAGASQLKAQQLLPLKPAEGLNNNPLDKLLAPKQNAPLLTLPKADLSAALRDNINNQIITQSSVDRMPVARLAGNSKMPVLKLRSDDKIPVVVIGGDNHLPGLPTFKTP